MNSPLKIKKIGIAGAGGIGSWLCRLLFEFGTQRNQFDASGMKFDLWDRDEIDDGNLLHQDFTMDDLGKEKAKVISERYVIFDPVVSFMEEKDFKKYDLIFSCVDSMSFRKTLYEYSWKNPELHWIDGRCTSRQGGVFNSGVKQENLKKYLSESKERGGCLLKFEKEQHIAHAMPIVVAGLMTQTFLNLLRGEKTSEKVMMV